MRTISATQQGVYDSGKQATHLRVKIDDSTGTLVDLTNLEGRDWVKSVQWAESVDTPVKTAQIVLHREVYEFSLATLKTASKFNQPNPLIQIHRTIVIETATTAQDASPQESDFEEMFRGRVDELDFGGMASEIRLRCRDQGGDLQDTFIETQTQQGAGGGKSLELVIQDILDDHMPAPIPTLYTPSVPAFSINQYLQSKESVFDAIRKLALMIGWDVRYRWDPGTSAFRLTLFEPSRTNSTVDYTWGPDRYHDVRKVSIRKANIRNVIRVVYGQAEDRTTLEVSDAASIAKYGRKFMELAEASSSQIDILAEAQQMADSALSDLAEPDADFEVPVNYFSPVQTGDLHRIKANGRHFDNDQDLAIVGFSHRIDTQSAKTLLTLRGKATAGVTRWLALDGRPGVAPTADIVGPDAANNVTAEVGVGTLIVTYDEPAEPDWYITECYVSDDSADLVNLANGKPAASFLRAAARTNRFEIDGLTPGVTYHAKVVLIDLDGNFISSTTIVADATQRNGPYHANPDSQFGTLTPNCDFGIATLDVTTTPPDFWFVDNASNQSTWGSGTDQFYFSTTDTQTGGRSLSLTSRDTIPAGNHLSMIETDFMVVEGDRLYRGDLSWRWDLLSGVLGDAEGNSTPIWEVAWYDIGQSLISRSTFGSNGYSGTYTTLTGLAIAGLDGPIASYFLDRGWAKSPATARFAKLGFGLFYDNLPVSAYQIRMFADLCCMRRALEQCRAVPDTGDSFDIPANTWSGYNLNGGALFDNAGGYDGGIHVPPTVEDPHEYTVFESGSFSIVATAELSGLAASTEAQLRIVVNGSEVALGAPIVSGGPSDVATVTIDSLNLSSGDVVAAQVFHTDTISTVNMEFANSRIIIKIKRTSESDNA